MAFVFHQKVLFKHCDPNGIVFYPRYFEMTNDAVEAWFADRLGAPFEELHGPQGLGVPTAAIEIAFKAPSFHGDLLDFTLTPRRLGRASLRLSTVADCAGERRLTMTSTLVMAAAKGGGARPWPDEIRARIEAELEPEEAP
ncbi:MAG: thioesterase family protein [Pseudomonadota bacterium]